MANKSRVVKVTAKDFQPWGIKPGSFEEMLDAFFDLDLPKTGGGAEPIVYDLTEVFEHRFSFRCFPQNPRSPQPWDTRTIDEL